MADLLEEFRLGEASLESGDFSITLRKRRKAAPVAAADAEASEAAEVHDAPAPAPVEEKPVGTPITSPMTGIYYGAPSPSSAPFVKVGDAVTAGQVVGLIEAMKVFNEIVSTLNGTVLSIQAESGQVVNPGDPLILIG